MSKRNIKQKQNKSTHKINKQKQIPKTSEPSIKPIMQSIQKIQEAQPKMRESNGVAVFKMRKQISDILNVQQTKYFKGDPDISGYSISSQHKSPNRVKESKSKEEDNKYFANMKNYISSLIQSAIGSNTSQQNIQGQLSKMAVQGDQIPNKNIKDPTNLSNGLKHKDLKKRTTEMRTIKNLTQLKPQNKINKNNYDTIQTSMKHQQQKIIKWRLSEQQKQKMMQQDMKQQIFKTRPKISNTPTLQMQMQYETEDNKSQSGRKSQPTLQKMKQNIKVAIKTQASKQKIGKNVKIQIKNDHNYMKQSMFPRLKPSIEYSTRSKTIDVISNISQQNRLHRLIYSNSAYEYTPVTISLVNPQISINSTSSTVPQPDKNNKRKPQYKNAQIQNNSKARKSFGFNRKLGKIE